MKEEELRKIWINADVPYYSVDAASLIRLRTEVDRLNKVIRGRDWGEIVIAILGALAFGGMAFWFENVYTKVGSVLLVLASVLIVWVLRISRKQKTKEQMPVRKQVEAELVFFRKQRRILKNVLAWYILPIFAGLTPFQLGLTESWGEFFVFSLVNIGLMIYAWYLNQQVVRKEIEPLIASLEQLQQNLENE